MPGKAEQIDKQNKVFLLSGSWVPAYQGIECSSDAVTINRQALYFPYGNGADCTYA